MALQKQIASINLKGLNTKLDDKLIEPAELSILENAVFRDGQVRKRNGFASFSTLLFDSSDAPSANNIFTHNDDLIRRDERTYLKYSPKENRWENAGVATPYNVEVTPIVSIEDPAAITSNGSMARDAAIELYCYSRDSKTFAIVREVDTGTIILKETLISATALRGEAIILNNLNYIVFKEGDIFKRTKFFPVTNSFSATPTTLFTQAGVADDAWNSDHTGTHIGIAFSIPGGAAINVRTYNDAFTELTSQTQAVTADAAATNPISLSMNTATDNAVITYFEDSTTLVRLFAKSITSISTTISPVNISNLGTTSSKFSIVATEDSTKIRIFFDFRPSPSTTRDVIKHSIFDKAGLSVDSTEARQGFRVASKPIIASGETGLNVWTNEGYTSSLQGNHYYVTWPDIDAFYSNGIGFRPGTDANQRPDLVNNNISYSNPVINSFSVTGALLNVGIARVLLERNLVTSHNTAFSNGSTLISGGKIISYDGLSFFETGFLHAPVLESVTETTLGTTPAGTRQYLFTYEWTDSQGNLHVSEPSNAITFTNTVNFFINPKMRTLQFSQKTDAPNDVLLVLYATVNGGSVFRRASSVSNDADSDAVTPNINITDSTSAAILYTDSGEIENVPPEGHKVLGFIGNRFFLGANSNNQNKLIFSKSLVERIAPEFTSSFDKILDENEGSNNKPITGIMGMDGRIIVFKQNSIHSFSGDGPLKTGEQDTFTSPQMVSSDTGCNNAKSIVLSPLGLFFKSDKGIYTITRSLEVRYLGAPVEGFNSLAVSSSVLIPDVNQIRFTTSDGDCLVYDYFFNQWSSFTNYAAVDSAIWRGNHTFVTSAGVANEENNTFLDDTSKIEMRIKTGWIKASGVQQFDRFYRVLLLGEFKDEHTLTLNIFTDYQEYLTETHTLTPFSAASYTISTKLTGSSRYDGTNDGVYQFRQHLEKQKAQAIQFEIIENQLATLGEGFALADLSLEVGFKKGSFKPIATKDT